MASEVPGAASAPQLVRLWALVMPRGTAHLCEEEQSALGVWEASFSLPLDAELGAGFFLSGLQAHLRQMGAYEDHSTFERRVMDPASGLELLGTRALGRDERYGGHMRLRQVYKGRQSWDWAAAQRESEALAAGVPQASGARLVGVKAL